MKYQIIYKGAILHQTPNKYTPEQLKQYYNTTNGEGGLSISKLKNGQLVYNCLPISFYI